MTQPAEQHPPRLESGDEIEVAITAFDAKSYLGLAKWGKKKVFVPGTLPGERVRVRIEKFWRRKILARVIDVIEASPHRTTPACKHFATCAGCQFQHVSYDHQLTIKKEYLLRQFAENFPEFSVPDIEITGSTHQYEYRNSITLHGPGEPGFWSTQGVDIVLNEECAICLPHLQDQLKHQRSEHFKEFLDQGIDNVMFRASNTGDCYVGKEQGSANIHWLQETVLHPFTENSVTLDVPAHAFWQANPHMISPLLRHALVPVADFSPDLFLEAYCGVGLFGLMAAAIAERVIGVEENRQAVEAAQRNARQMKLKNYEVWAAKTEEKLDTMLANAPDKTTLLVDPPRCGLTKQVIKSILAAPPQQLIYVSCGPASLAQNLKKLCDAYDVTAMTAVDLFPQTRHIETIAVLARKS